MAVVSDKSGTHLQVLVYIYILGDVLCSVHVVALNSWDFPVWQQ